MNILSHIIFYGIIRFYIRRGSEYYMYMYSLGGSRTTYLRHHFEFKTRFLYWARPKSTYFIDASLNLNHFLKVDSV